MKKTYRILFFLVALTSSCFSFGQYSGTYTVGGSSPDFPSFDSAFTKLSRYGISGNVRLNVRSGKYTERFTINTIKGTGVTSQIKVAPDPKNNAPVIIKNTNGSSTTNYIVNVKQGFINFDSIEFRVDSSSQYGTIIDFLAPCQNITFNYCVFYGKVTTFGGYANAIINEYYIYTVDNLKIKNSVFYDGSYAVSHINTKIYEKGFEFINNKVYNFGRCAVRLTYQSAPIIQGNYVSDKSGNYDYTDGLDLQYCDSVKITDNEIYICGKNANYGILVSDCISSKNYPSIIANNFIGLYDSLGLGGCYGLAAGGNYMNIVHNSIYVRNSHKGTRAAVFGGNGSIFKNNIVINSGNGVAFDGEMSDQDYNNYYSAGSALCYYRGDYIFSMEDLREHNSKDAHSISRNISFKNPRDLHTHSAFLNAAGIPIKGYEKDIDSSTRDTTTPDIGADEFELLKNDLGIVSIIPITMPDCGIDSAEIHTIIKNLGTGTVGGFNVFLDIDGGLSKRFTYSYKDSLKSQQFDTIRFGKFATAKGGNFNFKIYCNLSTDGDKSSDTLSLKKYINAMSSSPSSKIDTICSNKLSHDLTTNHSSSSILKWYSSKKGGKFIKETNKLTLNGIKKDTSFYVSAATSYMTNSYLWGNTSGNISTSGGAMFDFAPKSYVQIDSFYLFTSYNKTQTVFIYSKKGTHKGFESSSSAWSLIDSVNLPAVSSAKLVPVYLSKPIPMEKDSIYGIYFYFNSKFNNPSKILSPNLNISIGTGLNGLFGSVKSDVIFTGEVSFRFGAICESERAEYKIKVNQAPIINLGKDLEYCANNGIKLELDAGGGFTSYDWSTTEATQKITITGGGTFSVMVMDSNKCFTEDEIQITENKNPIITLGKDTSFCTNKGINVKLNAGNGFKTYKWSDSSSNQTLTVNSAGAYYVRVTDKKNCEGWDTLHIIENKNPIVFLGNDTSYCANGIVHHFLDAGKAYKNYYWSTSAITQTIDADGGVYSVQVIDSNNCVGRDTIQIIKRSLPNLTLGKDIFYCEGDTINKELDAGPGYIYNWSTGAESQKIKVTSAGKYFVNVTDFYNCQGKDTIDVIKHYSPKIDLGNNILYCEGDTIIKKLDAGSGPGYIYYWSTGAKSQIININSANKYFVKVTDTNNCIGSDTILVIINSNPKVDLGPDRIIDPDLPINETLNAGSGFKSYEWNTLDKTQSINVKALGTYFVKVQDKNGCYGTDTINIKKKNFSKVFDKARIKIFPNPTKNKLYLVSEDLLLDQLEIFDITGQLVYKEKEQNKRFELDVTNRENGIYLMVVRSGNNSFKKSFIIYH